MTGTAVVTDTGRMMALGGMSFSTIRYSCKETLGISGKIYRVGARVKILRLKTAVVEGNFDWTFVRIVTDEGIQGLGECFFAPGLTAILAIARATAVGRRPARYSSFVPQIAARDRASDFKGRRG